MLKAIIAYDEDGNQFTKQVRILSLSKGNILSFGWPVEYYVKTLMNGYPHTRDLCIDGIGRNHRGSPVFIRKNDLNQTLKEIKDQS